MARAGDIEDWANDEFGAAKLGDARLTSRLVSLARQLSRCPQTSFPQSLDAAQLKGAYRFFDNAKVDPEGVLVWRDNPDERRATIKLRMSRQK